MKHHAPPLIIFFGLLCLPGGTASAQWLREILARSLAMHPAVQSAETDIAATHGRYLQALSPENPALAYSEEEIPGTGSIGDGMMRYYTVSQSFDVPLLIGARAWKQSHLSDAAKYRLDVARRTAREDCITVFADWVVQNERYRILREAASRMDTLAGLAARRVAVGQSSRLEELRFTSAASEARVRAARQSSLLAEARSRFAILLELCGIEFDESRREALETYLPATWNLSPGTDAALSHPSVRSAMAEADAAAADAAWRALDFLPRFTASWFRQEAVGRGWYWGGELSAQIPLWFFFGERGRLEEAAAEKRKAGIEARLMVKRTERVNRQALSLLTNAISVHDENTKRVREEAGELLRAAEQSYTAGRVSYVEFLDAWRAATEIHLEYLDSLSELFKAIAAYEHATGILIIQ